MREVIDVGKEIRDERLGYLREPGIVRYEIAAVLSLWQNLYGTEDGR